LDVWKNNIDLPGLFAHHIYKSLSLNMKFSNIITPVAGLVASAQAQSGIVGTSAYGTGVTTIVVTDFTTVCPSATTFAYHNSTYTVTSSTTLTITNCPCTLTISTPPPVTTTSTYLPSPPPPAYNGTASVPTTAYPNGTAPFTTSPGAPVTTVITSTQPGGSVTLITSTVVPQPSTTVIVSQPAPSTYLSGTTPVTTGFQTGTITTGPTNTPVGPTAVPTVISTPTPITVNAAGKLSSSISALVVAVVAAFAL
jgi:hypothetical protein